MTAAPAVLRVSPADVQRGWLELNEPVALTVTSNAQSGPTLVVSTAAEVVERGVLTGFSDPVRFGAGQETIQLPPQRAGERVRHLLTVRLLLAPGVQPGEYAFPVRFHSADGPVSSAALH